MTLLHTLFTLFNKKIYFYHHLNVKFILLLLQGHSEPFPGFVLCGNNTTKEENFQNNEQECLKIRHLCINTYALLCPINDLLDLKRSNVCYQYIQKEIKKIHYYNTSKRHRFEKECLLTDAKIIQAAISQWSTTSNVSKMWVCATTEKGLVSMLSTASNVLSSNETMLLLKKIGMFKAILFFYIILK